MIRSYLCRCSLHHLLLGFSLLGLIPGCKSAPAAEEETSVAPVQAEHAREFPIEGWSEVFGTTQPLPSHAARISAAVEGRVLWVLGDGEGKSLAEGQVVGPGQIIAQLDDRVARANRDRTAAAQKELEQQRKQADYAVQLAEIEVKRLENLSGRGSTTGNLVSPIELDRARVSLQDAQSKLQGASDKLASGQADLKALNEQLQFYTLRAPIAGRLGAVQVVPGQTLSVGAVVADVVDLDVIDVLCFVPPAITRLLALGQEARIAPNEARAQTKLAGLGGKVAFIAVQAQPDTGNFAVKVRFPNPDLKLRGNTVHRLEVLTQPPRVTKTIPETALMEDQDPPSVVIIDELKTVKNKETNKDEQVGKARKLRAIVGTRDRTLHVVELLRLEDPEKKTEVPFDDETLFITKGKNGLETGDQVKIEQEDED